MQTSFSEKAKGDIAVSVRGLSKAYRIAHNQERARTMQDAIVSRLRAPFARPEYEEFWALKDISFDVKRGDVVGIIGRNGAGKSTLLKVLSRITKPTQGEIRLYGRVGSLLEVGTGFHPELTGRENIFLNGAILGMARREIDRQFDAIVEFAEVAKFLDTPVKRYSSGMYVRLAFAVAAHLNPEILIVDEVLAVGDAEFQKKCLGKMEDVASTGRTVLFVTHNMAILQRLCRHGIMLKNGKLFADAPIEEAVGEYLRAVASSAEVNVSDRKDRKGKGDVRLEAVEITTNGPVRSTTLTTGQSARFVFRLTGISTRSTCIFTIYDHLGLPVAAFNSAVPGPEDRIESPITETLVCEVNELLLAPGRYRVNVAINTGVELQDHLEGAALFDVEPGHVAGRAVSGQFNHGSVVLPHRWRATAEKGVPCE